MKLDRMDLVKLWAWLQGLTWRGLALLAIVFEAGISGSFLAEQMKTPLPYWWGYFGAIVQGLATFGGVDIVQKGNRKGWVVILIAGVAGMTFSFMFFDGVHDLFIGSVMAVFPMGVAVMAGLIDSSEQEVNRKRQLTDEDREFERLRVIEEDRFRREREMERDRLRTQLKMEEVRLRSMSAQNGHADGQERSMSANGRTETDKSAFVKWYMENPSATGADVARAFGCSERTGRRWIQEMNSPNGVVN